jgi:hypothetical protein
VAKVSIEKSELRGRYGYCITGLGLHSRSYLNRHIPSDETIMGQVAEKKMFLQNFTVFKCIINSSKFITESEMFIVFLTAESIWMEHSKSFNIFESKFHQELIVTC